MAKKLFLLASGILLSVVFTWSFPSSQGVLPVRADSPCNLLSGVSGYASYPDSGVMDFDYADYVEGETRDVDGALIPDDYKTCVNYTDQTVSGYAWNNNWGWLQMDWTVTPGGSGQPELDAESGFWKGYAWSDHIGWVWFDWSCDGVPGACDDSLHVHVDETENLTGYAWNDSVGWIDFGHGSVTVVPDDITVALFVELTPNPLKATKYGENGVKAPLASGKDGDEYVVKVSLADPDGNDLDDTNYGVEIEVTATEDSMMCFEQLKNDCVDDPTEAVVFSDVAVYNSETHAWELRIRSFVPTSNMNGYDQNGDGVIDYYFDVDPADPTGLTPSDSVNQFVLESIFLTVTPKPGNAEVIIPENGTLFNLTDSLDGAPYALKFAPAIEVTNLERVQTDGSYIPYLLSAPTIEQNFQGLVVQWRDFLSAQLPEFKVIAQLSVEAIDIEGVFMNSFLFDRDDDGKYEDPAVVMGSTSNDSKQVVNEYSIVDHTNNCGNLDGFESHAFREVPVKCVVGNWFFLLGEGAPDDMTEKGYAIEHGMITPPPVGEDGGALETTPTSPSYTTSIQYTIFKNGSPVVVNYRSNYLPQPSSLTDYQENLGISGSVTSMTGEVTGASADTDVVVIGDIATITVRNELFRRFSEYTKGVTPPWSGGGKAIVKGNFEDDSGKGVELLDGKMLYYKDVDEVKIQADGSTEKTIVVYGGNIFIETDLTDVGLVAFKDNEGYGGNIYIQNNVINLENIHIFAEGSVFSSAGGYGFEDDQYTNWGTLDTRKDLLKNQLYFKGSLVSHNTIFGYQPGGTSILPNGVETVEDSVALEYDLNQLREFTQCWKQLDLSGAPIDDDEDGSAWDTYPTIPDPDDVENCPGALRSENIPMDSDYANVPVYFEYTPPPSSLSLLGESQAGSLNVFD